MLQTEKRKVRRLTLNCQCPACNDIFTIEATVNHRGSLVLGYNPKVGINGKVPYHLCESPGEHRLRFFRFNL